MLLPRVLGVPTSFFSLLLFQMLRTFRHVFTNRFTGLLLIFCIGCNSGNVGGLSVAESKIRDVGRMYGHYLGRHGRPPADLETFEKFLTTSGVKNIDDVLSSPRDGEKLVLLFGDQLGPESPDGFPWIGYEKTGGSQDRIVVSARGMVEVMDHDTFETTFSGLNNSAKE